MIARIYKQVVHVLTCCFFIAAGSCLYAQESVTVFLEQRLQQSSKNTIREMTDILKKSFPVSFSFDSVNRFTGKGVYITTATLDYYKKSQNSISKSGPEGSYTESGEGYLYITANTDLALQESAYKYLEQLGFRFYFPDPLWHYLPSGKSIFKKIKLIQQPSFVNRSINMGWGEGTQELRNLHLFWQRANTMGGSLQVNNGHAYNSMVIDNKKEFQDNPEYISKPLVNGAAQYGSVFNYASPGLVSLAHKWLSSQFINYERAGRYYDMLSLEPFDGSNFCDLPACKEIGNNTSDQVIYFTNEVAKKLKKTNPGKWIGLLAYNDHIDIPKYKVEDNIFITLTNGYNHTNYTTDELIDRWRTKVSSLGIYDYISIYTSDNDMPGRGVAGNYKRISESIKKYAQKNVKVYIAESTYGWINKGLGHYIASRLLWDSKADVDTIISEFFSLMFPSSKKEIAALYQSWITYNSQAPLESDLYTWYSLLHTAFSKTTGKEETERLMQIGMYLDYVKLMREFRVSTAANRVDKGINVLAYMWQVLGKGVIASYAGLNEFAGRLKPEFAISNQNVPWKQKTFQIPQSRNEWMSKIDGLLPGFKKIEKYQAFKESSKIAKPDPKLLSKKENWPNTRQHYIVQYKTKFIIDAANSDSLFFKITAGGLSQQGNVKIKVYLADSKNIALTGRLIKESVLKADNKEVYFDLSKYPRKKLVFVYEDAGNAAKIYFPRKLKYSVIASAETPLRGGNYNQFYFYVPPGVSKFYVVKNALLRIVKPGKSFTDYDSDQDLIEVNVNPGEAGWWIGSFQMNDMYFIGIPPLISTDPESFLFP